MGVRGVYLAYRVYRYRGIIPLPSAQSLPLLGSGYSLVTSRLLVRVMLLPWRYQQVPEGTRRTTGVPVGLRGGGTSTRDTSIYTPGNQGKDRHNPPPYVYPPTGYVHSGGPAAAGGPVGTERERGSSPNHL